MDLCRINKFVYPKGSKNPDEEKTESPTSEGPSGSLCKGGRVFGMKKFKQPAALLVLPVLMTQPKFTTRM